MTSGSKKILIVDDDTDFVESVSSFLEANEYSVLRAHTGQEGLKLAKMERPDLIIMDIMMTERTEGFFTIHEIRRTPELASVPIFVLSSIWSTETDFQVPPGSEWLAHEKLLAKPIDMNDLLDNIRHEFGANEESAESSANNEAEA